MYNLHQFVTVDLPQFANGQNFPKTKYKRALICKLHIFFLLLIALLLLQALWLRMKRSEPNNSRDSFITGLREIGLKLHFHFQKAHSHQAWHGCDLEGGYPAYHFMLLISHMITKLSKKHYIFVSKGDKTQLKIPNIETLTNEKLFLR